MEDEGKKVEGKKRERRYCGQSVLSVPTDKTNLSEYSSTSNAVCLKFFSLILGLLTWYHSQEKVMCPGTISCSAERALGGVFVSCSSLLFFHGFMWFLSQNMKIRWIGGSNLSASVK